MIYTDMDNSIHQKRKQKVPLHFLFVSCVFFKRVKRKPIVLLRLQTFPIIYATQGRAMDNNLKTKIRTSKPKIQFPTFVKFWKNIGIHREIQTNQRRRNKSHPLPLVGRPCLVCSGRSCVSPARPVVHSSTHPHA